jgi:hypothetical protein
MIDFQLYRITVYPSKQLRLFEPPKSAPDVLRETIVSLPSLEHKRGAVWHIGNIITIDSNGLYFRVGRTSKSTIQIYQDGVFEDHEFETAPYTHVIFDIGLEVCGIAKQTKLSRSAIGIANQFVSLLTTSKTAKEYGAQFEIAPILDPNNLIAYLKRATSINKFWMSFRRPNPFDANIDFVVPMQRLLNESGGEKGKTELAGKNLKPDNLERLARSAAATGDEATAWIQVDPEGKYVKKHLKGNSVIVKNEDLSGMQQIKMMLQKIREAYKSIRGKTGNDS